MPAYKDNNGKWFTQFYYTNYDGDKKILKKRGFKTKREADAFELEFLNSQQFQPTMSFSQFLEMYKKDAYTQLREKTKITKNYRHKRILSHFEKTPLNEIEPKDIKRWQNDLINEGLSSRYIGELQNEFSTVLNHAVKFYGLSENPIHKAGRPKIPNEIPSEMRFWTLDDYKQGIDCISNLKAKTAINLLYWTGMRKGELYALTWGKIDFENKTILINRSLQRIHGENIITATKTYESRTIKIPDTTIDQLKEYKEHCIMKNKNDIVFPWEKRFLENGIKEAAEKSGIERIHIHGLRHSHASYLINNNINIVLISKRLGHKNTSITLDTYSHFYPTVENDLLCIMNNEDL